MRRSGAETQGSAPVLFSPGRQWLPLTPRTGRIPAISPPGDARTSLDRYAVIPARPEGCGRASNPKADIVVAVAGVVPVAVGGAEVVRIVVPGAAAQHTPSVRDGPQECYNAKGPCSRPCGELKPIYWLSSSDCRVDGAALIHPTRLREVSESNRHPQPMAWQFP